MKYHIHATCKKYNVHSRRISSIRGYIMKPACHFLVIALVVSTLDYCNARSTLISANTSPKRTHSCRSRGCSHINVVTPVLADLHWLSLSVGQDIRCCTLSFSKRNILVSSPNNRTFSNNEILIKTNVY